MTKAVAVTTAVMIGTLAVTPARAASRREAVPA